MCVCKTQSEHNLVAQNLRLKKSKDFRLQHFVSVSTIFDRNVQKIAQS